MKRCATRLLEEAKKVFKPEFINRLDDIIVFHQLTKADLMQIVELEVAKVLRRVKAKEVHIELEQSAKEFLIEKGYDPHTGRGRCAGRWNIIWKIRSRKNCCAEM